MAQSIQEKLDKLIAENLTLRKQNIAKNDKMKALEKKLTDLNQKLMVKHCRLMTQNETLRKQNMGLIAENMVFAAEIKNGLELVQNQPQNLMVNVAKLKNGGFNGLINKLWDDNSWKEKAKEVTAKYRNVMDECTRLRLNYQILQKEHNELKKKKDNKDLMT